MFAIKSFETVRDVVAWRLCLGCGACAFICPDDKVRLVDLVEEGIRPVLSNTNCGACSLCLDVCPAVENDCRGILRRNGLDRDFGRAFGPVLEVWEGYAMDDEIRSRGSSGGAITALSLYCLEREGMHGVLHVGGDPGDPIRNRTRLSRSRAELLSCTGSRYAPASVCDQLQWIESAPAPCVFVGQPSEATALRKVERIRPSLSRKIGVSISFFCAGSPATQGTIDFLAKHGLKPDQVEEVRYRGLGWPGNFAVRRKGSASFEALASYKESWGFLQKYRPFALYLNPDSSGEYADISCGDPWYREINEKEPGLSLVVVRTERGRRIVQGAMQAGYIKLEPLDAAKALASQRNLSLKRGAIWGRVATMALFGLPVPRLRGFGLFSSWLRLSLKEKLRSTVGTVRRIMLRGYLRPRRVPMEVPETGVEGSPGFPSSEPSGTSLARSTPEPAPR